VGLPCTQDQLQHDSKMQVLGKETAVFVHVVVKFIFLSAIFMKGLEAKSELISNGTSQAETAPQIDCGARLIADFTSNIIIPPELPENETKIYCEWLIEAKHPSYSVGVYVLIDHDINIYFENHFKLDIYDGSQAKQSKQLFSWPGEPEHGFYILLFGLQRTSTSSKIFLNYTKFAHDGLLDVVIHYFICGGQLDTGMEFSSPLFLNTSFPIPLLSTQCKWEIIKPAEAIYISLEFDDVNLPSCDLLSLATTNGTLMAVEFDFLDDDQPENADRSSFILDSAIDQKASSPELASNQDQDQSSSGRRSPTDYYVTSPSEPIRKVAVTNICNNNTDNIVYSFTGPSATLQFVGNASASFSAMYKVVFPPYKKTKPKTESWFYSYIQVLIYMPVGFAIGLGIICCQGRKKRYIFRKLNKRLRRVQRENSDVSTWVETNTTTASTRLQYNCEMVTEETDLTETCIKIAEISPAGDHEGQLCNKPLLLHGIDPEKEISNSNLSQLSPSDSQVLTNGSRNHIDAKIAMENNGSSL